VQKFLFNPAFGGTVVYSLKAATGKHLTAQRQNALLVRVSAENKKLSTKYFFSISLKSLPLAVSGRLVQMNS